MGSRIITSSNAGYFGLLMLQEQSLTLYIHTWLDSSISNSEIQLHGYSLVRRDKTRRKGGVLIYVSSNLDYKVIQEFENDQPDLQ